VTFRLTTPAVLSRSEVFRDETLRHDLIRQEVGWSTARLIVVDDEGRTPVEWTDAPSGGFEVGDAGSWDRGGSARLRTRPTEGATPVEGAVLLGEQDGVAYWAVRGKPDVFAGDDPTDWADLRMAGAVLDGMGAGLFVTAVAVLNWHDTARYCSRDGSPTRVAAAGWHRHCEAAGHEEYPRTDPAVICLVHDGGAGDAARVLLARQPVWPIGRFTVLAGFVEAGESLEACVRREIHEEVGVHVRDVAYLGSQAWPFPRSLMLAFEAVADPEAPLAPADGEIAEAMWVTRADVREALQAGDWGATEAPLLLPGKVSIARSMIESWAEAD
jgi:NAD+ diphosphatase